MGSALRLPAAIVVCLAVMLAGCSGPPPARAAVPSSSTPSSSVPSPSTARSTPGGVTFTVAGTNPVLANGSQDTHAQTPDASCDSATLASDHALGLKIARGFALAGLPASADLLQHFLAGSGTGVSYPAGSRISQLALASSAFQAVNNEVQETVIRALKAGQTHVQLSAAQLPTVAFESTSSDLYWGFRGTQGLAITGSGRRENGRYTGTLSYVIRDSYGFPAGDTLGGFGAPMRYLQTACGAPQQAAGAHWFPDAITVTVPFSQPA